MQRSSRTFIAYTFCFLSFAAFGYYHLQFNTEAPAEMTDMSSTTTEFETPEQCGDDRNYLQADLNEMPADLKGTRKTIAQGQPTRQCVTYIMKNFMPLDVKKKSRVVCRDPQTQDPLWKPFLGADGQGFKAACVTEPYVNSVYNSMIDVSDCLNIPMKELLPKLFNESGLHVNTLGGGGDGGVGQLTVSALRDDVFERYDKQEKNPSGYVWYLQEMALSSKASCKRILANDKAIKFMKPVFVKDKDGKETSKFQRDAHGRIVTAEAKVCASEVAKTDSSCFPVWDYGNRCTLMATPENPLKNVLVMGMLYRNNLRNITGVSYKAGEDFLEGQPYAPGTPYQRYFADGNFVERFRRLGISNPDQEVIKQILIALGFNTGIKFPRKFLVDYLTRREKLGRKLANSDVNFQDTETGKWAIVTNIPTFWRGLSSEKKDDYQSALKSFEVVSLLGLDYKGYQKSYEKWRNSVQVELASIAKKSIPDSEKEKLINNLLVNYDQYRKQILAAVYPKSASLTLPEFMRIAHAYEISTDINHQAGGAPGYLSFLAGKYKVLEGAMGVGTCTPEKYLKF